MQDRMYEVPDREDASEIGWACGIYASAILARTTFADMMEWYRTTILKKGRGLFTQEVQKCLDAHGYELEQIKLTTGPSRLHALAKTSNLSERDVDHLLVFSEHVAVFRNGKVNERRLGGWVDPTMCKNRRVDEVYKVNTKNMPRHCFDA